RRPLTLEAGRCERVLAPAVVADAHDLAVAEHHDLEKPRDQALRAQALEAPPAELDQHAVAEIDHVAGPQPVRLGAAAQGAHDLVGGFARLPRTFVRGMPGHGVVEAQANLPMSGAASELEQ